MAVVILNGPDDKKCWVCELMKKDIKKGKSYGVACYDELLDGTPYQVEAMGRFCCRCGAELMSEEDYREAWMKRYPETNSRLFTIPSEIVTEELVIAMDNAAKDFYKKNFSKDENGGNNE